ncbi:madf domain transcription factor [Holotrichia oblita]|uniref:Madf domain transcription factor n=1 Tax=Holotrichia oblita TaxID=644536 RepID=A0ACB9T748_HOLOL|nr:madf domain transcription factor [Holotrichia oblita]
MDFSESDNDTIMSLDVELFISEIKKRPALYNPNLQEYGDKNLKKRLWLEICPMFVANWSDLRPGEKSYKARELQKRWHNLRTCYNREYKKEKKEELLQIPQAVRRRRRKYVYYNDLSFLQQFQGHKRFTRETSSEIEMETQQEGESDLQKTITRSNNSTPVDTSEDMSPPPNIKSETYEMPLLEDTDMIERRNDYYEEIDEDRYFLLSLLPAFRRFTEDQKYAARIEIMQAMRRVNSSGIMPN